MDWIKIAKDIQDKEVAQQREAEEEEIIRKDEILAAEKNWVERVLRRVQDVSKEGFPVRVHQKPGSMELAQKGTVKVEFLGHRCFGITYHNVRKPTNIILSKPITVNHHRHVKVREMNEHNIEEVIKFAVLGMQKYCDLSPHSRIEKNLADVIESRNFDEHV
jgi:hypothetical protein